MNVFISYRSESADWAEEVRDDLAAAGFTPWLDRSHLIGGDIQPGLWNAIRHADALVVLASPMYLDSEFVLGEICAAVTEAKVPHTYLLARETLERCPVPLEQGSHCHREVASLISAIRGCRGANPETAEQWCRREPALAKYLSLVEERRHWAQRHSVELHASADKLGNEIVDVVAQEITRSNGEYRTGTRMSFGPITNLDLVNSGGPTITLGRLDKGERLPLTLARRYRFLAMLDSCAWFEAVLRISFPIAPSTADAKDVIGWTIVGDRGPKIFTSGAIARGVAQKIPAIFDGRELRSMIESIGQTAEMKWIDLASCNRTLEVLRKYAKC